MNNNSQLNDSRNNNNNSPILTNHHDYSMIYININKSVHKLNQMVGMNNSHINNQKKIMMKRIDNKSALREVIKE